MGTVFSVEVRPGDDAGPAVVDYALGRAFAWLHWVDATFSTYRADSEVSRLRRGDIDEGSASPEVRAVLRDCRELAERTAGYFSAYADGALDPSGLVKGWAISQASELLRAAGLARHCVNGGGDVQCSGGASNGQPWRIGIAHPLSRELLAGVVGGRDLGVATSGCSERGAHIIDPHTGRRAAHFASVTIAGPSVAQADAYATAAFAMGAAAPAWIESLPGYDGLVVAFDGQVWTSIR